MCHFNEPSTNSARTNDVAKVAQLSEFEEASCKLLDWSVGDTNLHRKKFQDEVDVDIHKRLEIVRK